MDFYLHFTDRYNVDVIVSNVVLVRLNLNYGMLLELSALHQVTKVGGYDDLNAIFAIGQDRLRTIGMTSTKYDEHGGSSSNNTPTDIAHEIKRRAH